MTDWIAHYTARRRRLRQEIAGGALLFLGNSEVPRNYPHNTYAFRQDSTFLYLTGLQVPDLGLWIAEDGSECLVADPASLDSIVWTGPIPTPADLAAQAGLSRTMTWAQLAEAVSAISQAGGSIHHLLPTNPQIRWKLAQLLQVPMDAVDSRPSPVLRDLLIDLRLHKHPDELAEIDAALRVTDAMHRAVMARLRPGLRESDLVAEIERIALAEGCQQSYHPIVTVRGEILHNHGYGNTLHEGQLLLNDSGAEGPSGYASDITRTLPVSGHFTDQQRAVYELVLEVQQHAIEAVRPGVPYRAVHDGACVEFVEGLKTLGLMQGNAQDAVDCGAHALFFVHGLGHALGLDVHDMEDYGEDAVGYGGHQARSNLFGTAYLRFARPLEVGHVVTVEPGLYFIPTLMDLWASEQQHAEYIRYDQLSHWRDFGGIRIEDDVVVIEEGSRVLGPGIPKQVAEIEALMGGD